MLTAKKLCFFLGFFIAQQFNVLGADLVSSDIKFFFRIADRNICQHENFMWREDTEVVVCKDNQFVPIDDLKDSLKNNFTF